MDFSLEYTKEQAEFAKEVRRWLDENAPKDLVSPWDIRKTSPQEWQKRREFARKLGEKGWLYPRFPRQYGGGGLDVAHTFVVNEEIANRNLGPPPHYDSGGLAAPAILNCATEEQKKRFLPSMLKGEATTWQLFTEPDAGTDEASQQTSAFRHVREKDHFVINGGKIFVGSIYGPPTQFLLLTKSDFEAPRHGNLAMFLAPANLPGITIQPLDLFPSGIFAQVGSGPGRKNSVFFDDVKIHESYLIGGDHDGWKVADATLTVEHGGGERVPRIPRNPVVEKFFAQCQNNPNVIKRLQENPELLHSVVDVYIGAQIERLWTLRNSGQPIRGGGPQLSMYGKMYGARLATVMASVLGPYAFADDEWALDDGIFETGERNAVCFAPGGTPEALKIVISRGLGIGR
ncbi:MAG: acyl-CoA dehydrogenase family protein [Chloroflexi bacterium]|nr:acyl-CoA dehydrogenase family protein [Chloroflexota bacterium]